MSPGGLLFWPHIVSVLSTTGRSARQGAAKSKQRAEVRIARTSHEWRDLPSLADSWSSIVPLQRAGPGTYRGADVRADTDADPSKSAMRRAKINARRGLCCGGGKHIATNAASEFCSA